MNVSSLFRHSLSGLALAVLMGATAFGQSVTTVPVGAMTYTFPATTQVTTTYISIPLTNPAVYTLPVASLTANTITFSGTPFPSGGLAQTGSPFFARIATGAQAGRTMLITANTTSTITVDSTDNSSQTTGLDTSGWALAAGDRIEIIVGDTLGSLLGDNTSGNPVVFVGASSSFSADIVGVYNKATTKFDTYFFSTTLGYWRSTATSTTNVNSLVIYPENSIQVSRKAGRSQTALLLVGDVPALAPFIKVTGSNSTIYSGSRFPVDVTLSQLQLTNWNKSNSMFSADTLSIYNTATTKFDVYYQKIDGTWRLSTNSTTDQSGVVIPATSSIGMTKKGTVSNSTSFVYSAALPYTL